MSSQNLWVVIFLTFMTNLAYADALVFECGINIRENHSTKVSKILFKVGDLMTDSQGVISTNFHQEANVGKYQVIASLRDTAKQCDITLTVNQQNNVARAVSDCASPLVASVLEDRNHPGDSVHFYCKKVN